MRRRFSVILTLLTLVLVTSLAAVALASPARNFVAPLSAQAGVDTDATGMAHFQFSRDGGEMHYRLIVANIENVLMSHIHLETSTGPVVVWLFPDPPPPPPEPILGRFDGVLATGTITADDLVGPLAGQTLDALMEEILDGNAFVNVHTQQLPGGEIDGAIDRPRGHVGGGN